jgi:hypothetical protein
MQSDRQEREEHAEACGDKIADALLLTWKRGERLLVKNTIECALDYRMRTQWKYELAEKMPPAMREEFNNYMRAV